MRTRAQTSHFVSLPRVFAAAIVAASVGAMSGCAGERPDEPYRAIADVPELMAHVLEPSAQVYWRAVGWILDAEFSFQLILGATIGLSVLASAISLPVCLGRTTK